MFNITTIKQQLANLVGFRLETGYSLPSTLTATSTSLVVNDHHPLLSLTVLDNVRPENMTLADFLTNIRNAAISKTINDLVTKKALDKTNKTILSELQIFDSTASYKNLESKTGRFVGWVIRPYKFEYLKHKIAKIGLQLLEADTFNIYVYHSSKTAPLQTIPINYTTPRSVQWIELQAPLLLSYTEQDTSGGYYYIGYYEDDLAASNNAIYKEHFLDRRPCGGCNPFNYSWYTQWSSYFKIQTAYVNSDKLNNDLSNFEVRDLQFQNNRNYGLNFKMTSYCDITDFIVEYKDLITYALLDRLAIDLLRYIEMSPTRNNVVSDIMSKESYIAINGNVSENGMIKVKGLMHDYDEKLAALNFNTSRLEPVCLPCNTRGIKWNSPRTNNY
jgi:hypothetical protein